jgi:hypothetical protein
MRGEALNEMAGSFEHSAGNAGVRPATRTAELPACGEGQDSVTQSGDSGSRGRCTPAPSYGAQLAAGARVNSRPSLRAGVARGGAAEGGARGARYLDTPLATSAQRVFRGTTLDGEILARIAFRKKVVEEVVASLNGVGEEDEAKRLSCCGSWFRYGVCPDGGHRTEPNPCNSMFCVNCSERRSEKWLKRILERCKTPGRKCWLLTLTVPNIPELSRDQLDRLSGHFKQLRRSKVWKRVKLVKGKWRGVTGGVVSVECVYSVKRNDWHPHLHALIELPKDHPDDWLDQLKAEWLRVTGDAYVLKLVPVYGRTKRGKKLFRTVNRAGLKEVVKYVTKAASFSRSPERVGEFLQAFKHVRRVQTFGSFHGALKNVEREPGDDGVELKCSCGKTHYHDQFEWSGRPVHISETIVGSNGERQLKWDFWKEVAGSVEESPPVLKLESPPCVRAEQKRLEFSGALPGVSEELPSLFAA